MPGIDSSSRRLDTINLFPADAQYVNVGVALRRSLSAIHFQIYYNISNYFVGMTNLLEMSGVCLVNYHNMMLFFVHCVSSPVQHYCV